MKLHAQQRFKRLNLYGLVQSLRYVVRLNDLKTAQHLRARLALALRHPVDLAKPLHDELNELFEISGGGYATRATVTMRSEKFNN